jgi:periplasmic protein CpxP/Spy
MDINYKSIPRSYSMKTLVPTFALGAILLSGFSAGTLLAQNAANDQTAAPTAPAQTQSFHAPNPQRQAKHMGKKLGLNADQVAKLEPILADRAQQVQSVRSDTTLAQTDRMAKLRGIRQDSNSKIEALLTDSQKQAFEQMKQNRKAHRQQPQATAPANS